MESTLYSTYGEQIPGTDDNDVFTVNGVRSSASCEGGNDSVDARNYLITVYGGNGNDTLFASRSYIDLRGDAGDDYLIADAHQRSENIANVTLTGGEGNDVFSISSGKMEAVNDAFRKVSSVRITDFGIGNDSLMLNTGNDDVYISHTTNDKGELVIRVRYNETALTFEGISDTVQLKNDTNDKTEDDTNDKITNVIIDKKTLSDIGVIPWGLELTGETLTVHSEYEGDLWLGGINLTCTDCTVWGDSDIKIIDASYDTVGGRKLGGNNESNEIRANNYGSLLWGGAKGDDTLIGGAGADMFYWGTGSDDNAGDNIIMNCGEDDLVLLIDINFDELMNIELTTDDNSIDIASDDSHVKIVKSDDARTTTVQLHDNSKWQYTYSDRSWQFKP